MNVTVHSNSSATIKVTRIDKINSNRRVNMSRLIVVVSDLADRYSKGVEFIKRLDDIENMDILYLSKVGHIHINTECIKDASLIDIIMLNSADANVKRYRTIYDCVDDLKSDNCEINIYADTKPHEFDRFVSKDGIKHAKFAHELISNEDDWTDEEWAKSKAKELRNGIQYGRQVVLNAVIKGEHFSRTYTREFIEDANNLEETLAWHRKKIIDKFNEEFSMNNLAVGTVSMPDQFIHLTKESLEDAKGRIDASLELARMVNGSDKTGGAILSQSIRDKMIEALSESPVRSGMMHYKENLKDSTTMCNGIEYKITKRFVKLMTNSQGGSAPYESDSHDSDWTPCENITSSTSFAPPVMTSAQRDAFIDALSNNCRCATVRVIEDDDTVKMGTVAQYDKVMRSTFGSSVKYREQDLRRIGSDGVIPDPKNPWGHVVRDNTKDYQTKDDILKAKTITENLQRHNKLGEFSIPTMNANFSKIAE